LQNQLSENTKLVEKLEKIIDELREQKVILQDNIKKIENNWIEHERDLFVDSAKLTGKLNQLNDFISWYSGMDVEKIQKAFDRFKREVSHAEKHGRFKHVIIKMLQHHIICEVNEFDQPKRVDNEPPETYSIRLKEWESKFKTFQTLDRDKNKWIELAKDRYMKLNNIDVTLGPVLIGSPPFLKTFIYDGFEIPPSVISVVNVSDKYAQQQHEAYVILVELKNALN
jgi:hypothetical protein